MQRSVPLQPVVAGFSNELVGLDIIGPLPIARKGSKYSLEATDARTAVDAVVEEIDIECTLSSAFQ